MVEMRELGSHIVVCSDQVSACTGCTSCEFVCSLIHDGYTAHRAARINCYLGAVDELTNVVYTCQQCKDHPCYDACPKKDSAMYINEDGIVCIHEERCIGCGLCRKHCAFDPPRINLVKRLDNPKRKTAKKCDLCYGREGGPACVEYCPALVLSLSDNTVGKSEGEK